MTDKKINFNDRFASRQDVQSNLTLEHSFCCPLGPGGYRVTYTTLVTGLKYRYVQLHLRRIIQPIVIFSQMQKDEKL